MPAGVLRGVATRLHRARTTLLIACLTTFVALPLQAGVLISATRFIYAADQQEIGLTLANRGKLPVLVKAWIDEGDPSIAAERLKPPFLLTPPLARVDAGGEQAYRLRYTGVAGALPQDRESLFWINLLEVPPSPPEESDGQATLQLAFQYRLKLFYRPAGLSGDPGDAAHGLRWSVASSRRQLVAENDAPYHVSLGRLALAFGSGETELPPATIAPRSRTPFELPEDAVSSQGELSIRYAWIDDWGGLATIDKPIARLR